MYVSLPAGPETMDGWPGRGGEGSGGGNRVATRTICAGGPQNAEAITWPTPVKLKAGATNSGGNSWFWLSVWGSGGEWGGGGGEQGKPSQMVVLMLTC